jgi:hypothetical protein
LIEKVAFAILPILFTCVVYLMNSLSHLSHEVTVLNNKISLVVTSDNKQATNTGAELAREKLRQDLEKIVTISCTTDKTLLLFTKNWGKNNAFTILNAWRFAYLGLA